MCSHRLLLVCVPCVCVPCSVAPCLNRHWGRGASGGGIPRTRGGAVRWRSVCRECATAFPVSAFRCDSTVPAALSFSASPWLRTLWPCCSTIAAAVPARPPVRRRVQSRAVRAGERTLVNTCQRRIAAFRCLSLRVFRCLSVWSHCLSLQALIEKHAELAVKCCPHRVFHTAFVAKTVPLPCVFTTAVCG